MHGFQATLVCFCFQKPCNSRTYCRNITEIKPDCDVLLTNAIKLLILLSHMSILYSLCRTGDIWLTRLPLTRSQLTQFFVSFHISEGICVSWDFIQGMIPMKIQLSKGAFTLDVRFLDVQAFLDIRGLNFRNFWFNAVYDSILFSSLLVHNVWCNKNRTKDSSKTLLSY